MRGIFSGRIVTVVTTRAIAGDIDVVKICRDPCNAYVAVIAGVAARDVCGCLTSCNTAVVTGFTSTDYLGMVDHKRGRPKVHAMTILTNKGCLHVCDMLASCIRTVMAARTIAGDRRVIKISWRPANGCVAVVAVTTAGKMSRMFASGCDSVVAGAAAA